jgi:hypothetical protein
MYRIVRRFRVPPFDRANELVASALGVAGLAGLVLVAVLSRSALYH